MNSIFSKYFIWQRSLLLLSLILTILSFSACKAQTLGKYGTEKSRVKAPMGTRIELTLVGYNYTNRYIDEFSVDGVGGGNLFVSSESNGGGGSVCCVSYRSGAHARKVMVRWQTDACTYNERTYINGEKNSDTYSFFKEVEVQVDPNIPDNPAYFEVHFYPDGHVEAAMTEHESPSRLKLNPDREDRSNYRQCPNDKKPKV